MKELTPEVEVCLALGYFDSVHLGHRQLLSATKAYADSHGVASAAATFCNNAYKLFNSDGKQVYTYAERLRLFDGLCEYVLPMRFDSRLKNRSAADFLKGLFAHYNIKAVVCGYDYLFGAGANGDAEFLKRYCEQAGKDCIVVDKFELNGTRVSTSLVKDMLLSGDIEKANEYLGEPFSLSGKVVHGRGAGRMFDIPTANLKVSSAKLLPRAGVYGASCVIDGKTYYGATNIGGRPTFGLSATSVEMMIADFNDSVYDKDMQIILHKYLRPVTKFDTPSELSKQVRKDIRWHE